MSGARGPDQRVADERCEPDDRVGPAKVRQEMADKLSPQERLKRLDAANLTATKERAKIAKLLKKA